MENGLKALFFLGRPFSPIYGASMRLRERFYRLGLIKQHTFSVPVISVGNLLLGGTGKTPTVQFITKLLQSEGYKPAVVCRGYRGKKLNKSNVVSDGKSILLAPDIAGDEPYLLAKTLPGIPVLTGKKRYLSCQRAITEFGVDCIVLDDGFQHLSVHRDIDIVLFDSTHLAGNSRIFPGGPLREPVSALHRCNCFLLTGRTPSNIGRAEKFKELLNTRFPGKPLYFSGISNCSIETISGQPVEAKQLNDVYAFCGIANPDRFQQSLISTGLTPKVFKQLPDHVTYSQSLVDRLSTLADAEGAENFITTEKDVVKLKTYNFDKPIYILKPTYSFCEDFKSRLLDDLRCTI